MVVRLGRSGTLVLPSTMRVPYSSNDVLASRQPIDPTHSATIDNAFSMTAIFHSQTRSRSSRIRAYPMKSIIFPACAGVIAVASLTTSSRAGGFSSAQFGGAHGNAASDSLTSIFYNPAGLALDDGTRAYAE